MYDTTLGTRVLHGAEARLFASAAWSLTDHLRDFVPNSVGQSFNHPIVIPVLDSLTAAQVIVLVERVTAYLLDSETPAPTRTAVLDATIAAVFHQVAVDLQAEIDLEFDSTEAEDDDTSARTKLAEAAKQVADPDSSSFDTPDPECAVMETWQLVIDRLCDRVLPDTDWQLESVAMDLEPHQSAVLKGTLGIHDDYFIHVVGDASVEDAAAAWCDMLERISGWRPEKWRFGGGLAMPADADIPPKVDVLDFPKDHGATTSQEENKPNSQQTQPVLLSDVMFELEGTPEEWSSFVDRKNGKVLSLPSDVIAFVENGEDPDDYCGEGKDYLILAMEICDSDDVVPLPSQFDIHEWSIMRDFCAMVESDSDRRELLDAVHGNGAFRHFKSTITRLDLRDQWYSYRDAAIEGIVVRWLESNSIQWSRTRPGEPPF